MFGTAALAAYRDGIPERVRSAIEPFPAFQGALLEFASGGPACVDLLVSNPALAANTAMKRNRQFGPPSGLATVGPAPSTKLMATEHPGEAGGLWIHTSFESSVPHSKRRLDASRTTARVRSGT